MEKPLKKIKKGQLKPMGKFEVITRSAKSHPGDGTHGNGVKGDRGSGDNNFSVVCG